MNIIKEWSRIWTNSFTSYHGKYRFSSPSPETQSPLKQHFKKIGSNPRRIYVISSQGKRVKMIICVNVGSNGNGSKMEDGINSQSELHSKNACFLVENLKFGHEEIWNPKDRPLPARGNCYGMNVRKRMFTFWREFILKKISSDELWSAVLVLFLPQNDGLRLKVTRFKIPRGVSVQHVVQPRELVWVACD